MTTTRRPDLRHRCHPGIHALGPSVYRPPLRPPGRYHRADDLGWPLCGVAVRLDDIPADFVRLGYGEAIPAICCARCARLP